MACPGKRGHGARLAACGAIRGGRQPELSSPRLVAAGEGPAAVELPSGAWACRIQDIRVGQRVLAELPAGVETDLGEADAGAEPEQATWRKLVLEARKADGSTAQVELLRPVEWVERHAARPGGVVEISAPECGIEGRAAVLSIGPCPAVPPGPGRVVTGTFRHASAAVVDVYVEGFGEPIGATANHPFWSEDRRAFVRADALQPGERLRALLPGDDSEDDESDSLDDGTDDPPASCYSMRVLRIAPRGTPEPVYNLEVQFVHVYHVTAGGVLVHNGTQGCGVLAEASTAKTTGGRRGNQATRDQLDRVRDEFLDANPGYRHVAGGRDRITGADMPEEYLRPLGGGRRGGSYADLTFEGPDGARIRFNTTDARVDGSMTPRERVIFDRIFEQTGEPIVAIPKQR